jgi:hypothetical protein
MTQVLSDPRMVDYLIQSQPQLQAMGPGIRQVMQSEEFRRTLTDPNMLRNMFEMNRMFSQMGMQVPGMPTNRPSNFPAPGVTNTTATHQAVPPRGPALRPFDQQPQQPNPFETMFPPAQPGQQGQQGTAPANPFLALFPQSGIQSGFGSHQQAPIPQQAQPQNQHPFGSTSPPMSAPQSPPPNGPQSPQLNAHQPFGSPYQPPQQQQPNYGQAQPQAQPQPNMTDLFSMLQSLQGLQMLSQGGPGVGTNPLPTGQQSSYLAPQLGVRADNQPLEERYQVTISTFKHLRHILTLCRIN